MKAVWNRDAWLGHGQQEEWHQRMARDPQSGSDRHGPMYHYHKGERLKLEAARRVAA